MMWSLDGDDATASLTSALAAALPQAGHAAPLEPNKKGAPVGLGY